MMDFITGLILGPIILLGIVYVYLYFSGKRQDEILKQRLQKYKELDKVNGSKEVLGEYTVIPNVKKHNYEKKN